MSSVARTSARATTASDSRASRSSGCARRRSCQKIAAETTASRSTRSGARTASSAPTKPPIELPTTAADSIPSASSSLTVHSP